MLIRLVGKRSVYTSLMVGWVSEIYTFFYLAMLRNIGWKFFTNPNALVARALKEKYYPRVDYLNDVLRWSSNYTWRSICSQYLVKRGIW